MNSFP